MVNELERLQAENAELVATLAAVHAEHRKLVAQMGELMDIITTIELKLMEDGCEH